MSNSKSPTTFLSLPTEILLILLSHMSIWEILKLEKTCHHLKSAVSAFFSSRKTETWYRREFHRAIRLFDGTGDARLLLNLLPRRDTEYFMAETYWMKLIWSSILKYRSIVLFKMLVGRRLIPEPVEWGNICRDILEKGSCDEIRYLLANGPELDGSLESALYRIILKQREFRVAEVLEIVLDDGRFDPGANDNTPIRLACEFGHVEAVQLLLEDPRVNPADCDNLAIRKAASNGHAEVVRLLLKDPRVDPAGSNYAIYLAAQNGHAEVVQLLMKDSRVNHYKRNSNEIRPAVMRGHSALVKLLSSAPRAKEKPTKSRNK